MEGSSGRSGCHGHYDFAGAGYLKENSTAPDCLSKIVKFRNDMKNKEWAASFEHDVYGGNS